MEGRSLAAPIPPALAQATVRAAMNVAAGNAAATGLVSASVASMVNLALRSYSMNLMKKVGLIGLLATLTIGTALVASVGSKERGSDANTGHSPNPAR